MHDDLRIQLEGGLEVLESAVHRYHALNAHLRSLLWRRRLARVRPIAHQVVAAEPEVLRALARAARRADGSALVHQVADARAELLRALRLRLRGHHHTSVVDALRVLDARFGQQRARVLPPERWQTACEALPASAPLVHDVAGFGASLEHVFSRPITPAQLPVSPSEWTELLARWAPGHRALDEAWRRMDAADPSGGLSRALHRRARRPPRWRRRPAHHEHGPLSLIHAEFWRGVATARATDIVARRLAPVVPSAEESLAVLGWLITRHEPPAMTLAPARAALMELVLRLELTADPAPLLRLAMTADADRADPDWARVRDALVLKVRAASTRRGLRLEASPRDSLAELMMRLVPLR